MKKKLMLLSIIIGLFIIACGCQNDAKTEELEDIYPEAMELIQKSSELYSKVENLEMKQLMDMTMFMPNMETGENVAINVHMDSNSIIFVEPLKSKTNIEINYSLEDENANEDAFVPEKQTMEQYMVAEDGKYIIYQYSMGEWFKSVIDNPELANQQLQGLDYIKEYEKFYKSGEIIGEETVDGVEAYKAQYKLNSEYMTELLNQYGLNETFLPDGNQEELMNKLIASLENVVYEIWFSKEDYSMIKLSADMQPMFEGIKSVLMEDESLTEEVKNEISNTFGSMKGKTEVYYDNINNCEDFEIPQEALDAKEMEMPYGV